MKKTDAENITRALAIAANGTSPSETIALLAAQGLAVTLKSEVDILEHIRRKTGGVHPDRPGHWRMSAQSGWVGLLAGTQDVEDEEHGMFSPAEAREIAMALILYAEQAERQR